MARTAEALGGSERQSFASHLEHGVGKVFGLAVRPGGVATAPRGPVADAGQSHPVDTPRAVVRPVPSEAAPEKAFPAQPMATAEADGDALPVVLKFNSVEHRRTGSQLQTVGTAALASGPATAIAKTGPRKTEADKSEAAKTGAVKQAVTTDDPHGKPAAGGLEDGSLAPFVLAGVPGSQIASTPQGMAAQVPVKTGQKLEPGDEIGAANSPSKSNRADGADSGDTTHGTNGTHGRAGAARKDAAFASVRGSLAGEPTGQASGASPVKQSGQASGASPVKQSGQADQAGHAQATPAFATEVALGALDRGSMVSTATGVPLAELQTAAGTGTSAVKVDGPGSMAAHLSQVDGEPAPAAVNPMLGEPRMLVTTPNVLEVGISGGAHRWLRVRAELGSGGEVTASLVASSAGSADALHQQLGALSEYLKSEVVGVSSLAVTSPASHAARPAAGFEESLSSSGSGSSSSAGAGAGAGAEGETGRRPVPQGFDGARKPNAWDEFGRGANGFAADAMSSVPVGLLREGVGGWLNVRV